ncbi:MAG: heavy metal translocating P-type ATPase [Bacteroidia bacterium]
MNAELSELKVDGMTCTNCAMSVRKSLEKQGMQQVDVNFASGEVRFENVNNIETELIINGIEDLGFKVIREGEDGLKKESFFSSLEFKLLFSAIFTIPLMLHMLSDYWLFHDVLFQLFLSIPVYSLGLYYFGKSAFYSLKSGVPNMDVLIFTGAASSLFYSVFGTFYYWGSHDMHGYMFYETGASIICFVLFGNFLEKRSVKKTTQALESLTQLQPQKAKLLIGKIASEVLVEDLRPGDMIKVNAGDQIPIDGELVEGEGYVDESMISGESIPQHKTLGSTCIGGTILTEGLLKVKVTSTHKKTILAEIIEMVKRAQTNKPAIQQLGDRVSAIFVPVVIGISLLTFLVSYFILDLGSAQSMLRAVAVLVISCPCAMGLATPTAVMVGIGRAAKRGILIKGGDTIEILARTKTMVFDKTGTLTSGQFQFSELKVQDESNLSFYQNMIFQIESHSSHPIAKSLVTANSSWMKQALNFENIIEIKGKGMEWELDGLKYFFGKSGSSADLELRSNGLVLATLSLLDEIKPDAHLLASYFERERISSVILSGDQQKKVDATGKAIAWKGEAIGDLMPHEKLDKLEQYKQQGYICMVGDGINDAPAMTAANVSVSFSKANDIARQAAQVVLMKGDMKTFMEAHQLSLLTYKTIKQNLFWAFFYNALCIPLAAAGFMHPMLGALSMAFSDVIVIGNSLALNWKRIQVSK